MSFYCCICGVSGRRFCTPIEGSVRILYDEDGNIHSYSKKSENTTGANNYVRRIGRAWLYYPAYPSDFEYFWGGGSYEEQGTKEVAMWATLMTDDIALSVKNCANVYRWPGVEDGDRGYCLAAQSPNRCDDYGDNFRNFGTTFIRCRYNILSIMAKPADCPR